MCKLIQTNIDNGEVPKDWSGAVVVVVHKGGPKSVMGNFKPGSLTIIPRRVADTLIRQKSDIIQHGTQCYAWLSRSSWEMGFSHQSIVPR